MALRARATARCNWGEQRHHHHTLHAMREMGLAIPQQIGLCGPEDWNLGDQMNWPELTAPQLTTASVHAREIGATATHLLFGPHCGPFAGQAGGSFAKRAEPARLHFAFPRQPDV